MNPSGEDINLVEDILIVLAKDYVNERDGLSLALSSENFASVYGRNRRSLNIQNCYFLHSLSSTWDRFFQQHIDPSHLSLFDASHCYWLPADSLLHCITRMTNLKELNIQDTNISLLHLPQIFKACNSIVKLSFTLAEMNLDQFKEGVMEVEALHLMTKGFAKLTHMKVFTFALEEVTYVESWLSIIGVLRWCRDCIDLFIKIANPKGGKPLRPGELDFQRGLLRSVDEAVSHLGWMVLLRNLVILSDDSPREVESWILHRFLSGLRGPNQLERLWLSWFRDHNNGAGVYMTGPSVKTLQLTGSEDPDFELYAEQYPHLEHLSGAPFRTWNQFPNLKDFRGDCFNGDEWMIDGFCRLHPHLERLHIDVSGNGPNAIMRPLGEEGDWKLPKLKVLVFTFWDITLPNGIDYLIRACPEVEELHVKNACRLPRERMELSQFLSPIRFNRLTWLSVTELNLFDGFYLPTIIGQCPKLERIHFECDQLESAFFSRLGECLSAATNLRDLRLKWEKNGPIDASHLELFDKALRKCSHLERFVFLNETDGTDEDDAHKIVLHSDFLLQLVAEMKKLVTLCIIGFDWNPSKEEVEVLKEKFIEEILSIRPSFRMQVGSFWLKVNDPKVPRIHHDEIIFPIDVDRTPPRF